MKLLKKIFFATLLVTFTINALAYTGLGFYNAKPGTFLSYSLVNKSDNSKYASGRVAYGKAVTVPNQQLGLSGTPNSTDSVVISLGVYDASNNNQIIVIDGTFTIQSPQGITYSNGPNCDKDDTGNNCSKILTGAVSGNPGWTLANY